MAAPGRVPPPVLGDATELSQVVQNLLENALKYSREKGRVEVSLGTDADLDGAAFPAEPLGGAAARMSLVTPSAGAGRYGWVRFRDDGVGIPREALPRLSERFYRVGGDAFTKEGTGLGLAIVKHILNRHRGGLAVESAPGIGSVFSVYVPHAAASPTEVAPDARSEPQSLS